MSELSVFAYGTLEISDVMEAVTGRAFDSAEATVKGYVRFLLKGRIYPGITSAPESEISGRVYFDLTREALSMLDEFEDEVYVRKLIPVQTVKGNWLNAYAYIIEPQNRGVLSGNPWIREKFADEFLASYLAACRTFHLSVRQSLPTRSTDG